MFEEILTPEIDEQVKKIIEEDPNAMPVMIAQKLNIPEAAVVEALPEKMRSFFGKENFDEIWQEMTNWEKVTFICQPQSSIIEFKGRLPKGKYGHGFFNLMEKDNPLGGHIKVDHLEYIYFLEKPFFGLESLSVQFFDVNGNHMCAVYVGREKKELIQSVKEGFYSLRSRIQ